MSMSTHAIGFKPADEKFKQMKAVWHSCEIAGIKTPDEVIEYFNGEEPDDKGVEVNLEEFDCCNEWTGEVKEGFEINVTKLPKDIKIIRFYNSY